MAAERTGKPRIHVYKRLPAAVETALAERFEATLGDDETIYSAPEILARAEGCDALVVTLLEKLTADVIAWLPETVRIVATCSVGTDHIDLAAAKQRGLIVTNTPGAVVEATADIAFLLILAATRRASEGEAMVRGDRWPGWRPTQLLGMGLQGRRLGLVGFGGIGQAVARRALAFGMEVHWHGPRPKAGPDLPKATFHAKLEDLLAVSDVLSLHAPSGPETRNIVNAETLALLPPRAVVVNTARGDLVDDEALIAALKGGRLMAAGLDVYRGEPAIDPRYRTLPNVFLLPHLGTATLETRTGMGMLCVENLEAYFEGREPANRVA
jgi:lactate dehydrogenase-like 2-hydroxyacid dehydrogenase